MQVVSFAMLVLMGTAAGLAAALVLERGGYGVRWDIALGVVGSFVGSSVFQGLGFSAEAGLGVVAMVGFLGAAAPIIAQRRIWPSAFLKREH
jgi:uncharacterized membrane protein YeaQ/YmgE (transglycosylase-associated protein family)